MIVVAFIAILLNTAISLWLRKAAKKDLNVRSAYMHMLGNAISAAGVVVAGFIVAFTHTSVADPIVSVLIGLRKQWMLNIGHLVRSSPAVADGVVYLGATDGLYAVW